MSLALYLAPYGALLTGYGRYILYSFRSIRHYVSYTYDICELGVHVKWYNTDNPYKPAPLPSHRQSTKCFDIAIYLCACPLPRPSAYLAL